MAFVCFAFCLFFYRISSVMGVFAMLDMFLHGIEAHVSRFSVSFFQRMCVLFWQRSKPFLNNENDICGIDK